MAKKKIKLILASSSKRRLEMLTKIGYAPDLVYIPNIDETVHNKEKPKHYVVRMAEEKAKSAINSHKKKYIVGADTIIVSGNQIIGKPKNYEDAFQILNKLSGKRHRVYGGICIISPNKTLIKRVIISRVNFRYISSSEIKEYLKTDEWKDKAGGYAIQGYASKFIKRINGNYDNVMGLSLVDFDYMIKGVK